MRIDLDTIQDRPFELDTEFELSADRLDTPEVVGSVRVRVAGRIHRVRTGHRLEGRIDGSGRLACSRCLQPVDWSMSEPVAVEYRPAAAAPLDDEVELPEGELDVAYLQEMVLELEDLAAEQVLLALPMKVVCRESCAGLCPTCGADRNAEPCDCGEAEIDPRWAPLAALRDDSSS